VHGVVKHLCDIFDEIKRVLRKDGTCWVNLGDTYSAKPTGSLGGIWANRPSKIACMEQMKYRKKNRLDITSQITAKSLCLIPQRFAIEMVNRGWILRNTIIWHKPNCMPSSAKDRFTMDFEYIYFFVKSNKVQFWTNSKTGECVSKKPLGTKGIEGKDWEWREVGNYEGKDIFNVRVRDADKAKFLQGATEKEKENYGKGKKKKVSLWTGHNYWFETQYEPLHCPERYNSRLRAVENIDNWKRNTMKKLDAPMINPKTIEAHRQKALKNGRNKRAVWTIPTKPFPKAHFAVYPATLIETPIKAGCPRYVCKKCGKARVKILEPTEEYKKYLGKGNLEEHHAGQETKTKFKIKANAEYKFKGYTDCGCNAGFEGGIVLDPFMGAGTTAVVAKKLGRNYLGIEIKQEYIDMAKNRVRAIPATLF